MKELTPTSYVILSILALRPWSAYELAGQMRRNAGRYWPRAERGVYDEPKNLVAHGFARAKQESVGRRARTVYRITPAGRRALRRWLASSMTAEPQLESEALARLGFAENGTAEDAVATLDRLAEQMAAHLEFAEALACQYRDGEGPYPERAHLISLVTRFMADYYALTEEWAGWAREQIEAWGDVSSAPGDGSAERIMGEIAERLQSRPARGNA